MEHLFVTFFESHLDLFRHFGYWILLVISLVESIPFLGMLIPGQTIIILAGFMVKLHFFGFWLTILVSTLGATCGDMIGFFLGRRSSHLLSAQEKILGIKKEHFEKTKALIASNPFKSIFFGRLHSLTRTLTPFVAGASHVNFRKFITIDLLSTFVWAFLSVLIGYIFGKSFENASAFLGSFIVVATFITICIILAVQYAKKKNLKLDRIDIMLFITSTVSIYLFGLIARDLSTGKLFNVFDRRIYVLREFILNDFSTFVMTVFTTLGNPLFLSLLCSVFVLYLLLKKQYKNVFSVSVILGTGLIVVNILKDHYLRIRPMGIILESGPSFPSGHMAMSMMLAILAVYTTLRFIKPLWKKKLYITLAYLTSLAIGFSRVYLGVHWASDVLAGLLLGIFWATFGIVILRGGGYLIRVAKKKHEIPLP